MLVQLNSSVFMCERERYIIYLMVHLVIIINRNAAAPLLHRQTRIDPVAEGSRQQRHLLSLFASDLKCHRTVGATLEQ